MIWGWRLAPSIMRHSPKTMVSLAGIAVVLTDRLEEIPPCVAPLALTYITESCREESEKCEQRSTASAAANLQERSRPGHGSIVDKHRCDRKPSHAHGAGVVCMPTGDFVSSLQVSSHLDAVLSEVAGMPMLSSLPGVACMEYSQRGKLHLSHAKARTCQDYTRRTEEFRGVCSLYGIAVGCWHAGREQRGKPRLGPVARFCTFCSPCMHAGLL